MKFLPYGRQQITEDDISAVVKTLKSDFLTQGPAVENFESAFCNAVGAKFAISCSNGTAGLHLAAVSADISAGDVVIVPAVTFVASANCARYVGADVVFADINADDLTVSAIDCERHIKRLFEQGRSAKALVTVDLAGHPCDMQAFSELKTRYGFVWIHDACHSLGGSWQDSNGKTWKTGEFSGPDFTVFSFHPVKHITSGEGGMITTHNQVFAERLKFFRTHGITKDANHFQEKEQAYDSAGNLNPWYYEMQGLGFNYRLTDFQAALAQSQLQRLSEFIGRRREIVAFYKTKLADIEVVGFPGVRENIQHAYHLAVIELDFEKIGKSRAVVMNELRERGIGTQVHYIPIPMMPYYSDGACLAEIPMAMNYYRRALSIPCFPDLVEEDLRRVVQSIEEVVT
jgi:UDP-4-amino-4,6-dideoxy-N-acetyl-beta-L-altrosamine transaminase